MDYDCNLAGEQCRLWACHVVRRSTDRPDGVTYCRCHQVLPSEFGQRLPPHFFLLPSYWRQRGGAQPGAKAAGQETLVPGLTDPLLAGEADLENGNAERPGSGPEAGLDSDGLAVAVAIRGLRRDFATTDGGVKRALDGLTLDVYADQITALLGARRQALPAVLLCSLWLTG